MAIKALFFDAANTLVHKPQLYPRMLAVLAANGIVLTADELTAHHRFLSEAKVFPDRTSREFYEDFNGELLRSFGLLVTSELLDQLFNACTYLGWEPFPDIVHLANIALPLGVISNWSKQLPQALSLIPELRFEWVLGSEDHGLRKPDPAFFRRAIDASGLAGHEIVYIGDSMRLDIEPALKLGIRAALIDRDGLYPHANVQRLTSFAQMNRLL